MFIQIQYYVTICFIDVSIQVPAPWFAFCLLGLVWLFGFVGFFFFCLISFLFGWFLFVYSFHFFNYPSGIMLFLWLPRSITILQNILIKSCTIKYSLTRSFTFTNFTIYNYFIKIVYCDRNYNLVNQYCYMLIREITRDFCSSLQNLFNKCGFICYCSCTLFP